MPYPPGHPDLVTTFYGPMAPLTRPVARTIETVLSNRLIYNLVSASTLADEHPWEPAVAAVAGSAGSVHSHLIVGAEGAMIGGSSRKRSAAALGAFIVSALWSGLVAAGPVEDCSPDNKDYDRRIVGCTQVIEKKIGGTKSVALAYVRRCSAYADKGDYDRAIADCTEAIRFDPNSAVAYSWRGLARSNKGDYDRAISDYDQAIRLAPSKAVPYSNRSVTYRRKGDADRALADANEAIRLDAKHSPAYVNR